MAIKKILTDLELDGKIGIGMTPSNHFDMDVTNVDNDSTIGVNLDIKKENTSGAGYASNVYGIKSYSKANSSEIVLNVGGTWSKAEHLGSGTTYYITGGTNRAYHSGSGNSTSISGTFSEGKVGGTGAGDHSYVVGVNSIAEMDNPNATADYLQGQHCTIKLNAGEVTDNAMCLILDLDHTGGTISGDFEYLRIQNDTLDSAVGGTARAINSLSTHPSEFGGSIQAPTFYLGSISSYIRNTSGDTELFSEAGLTIESADGMIIEISDVIDISGGGEMTSDGSIEAASFIKTGGTSSQFLKADGSVDSSTYLTSADITSSQWDAATGGINYAGGNVGIGTTSPDAKLEVVGALNVTDHTALVSAEQSSLTFTSNYAGLYVANTNQTDGNYARINFGDGDDAASSAIGSKITSHSSNYSNLEFWTRGSNGFSSKMLIEENGNVGIGTASPRAKLEVGGFGSLGAITNKVVSTIIDGGYSTTNQLQYNTQALIGTSIGSLTDIFTNTGSETKKNFYVGIISDNSYFNNPRWSVVNNGAERLVVNQPTGNVGIGTTDPQARLDVNGGIRMANSTATASADNEGTMRYYTDANGSYMDICMQYQNSGTPANDYKWTNVVRHIFPS